MPLSIARLLSHLFTALLLLVCAAAAILWARTVRTTSVVQYAPPDNDKGWSIYRLSSVAGRFGVWRIHGSRPGRSPASADRWQFDEYPSPVPSSRTLTWGYAKTAGAGDSRVQLAGFAYYETLPAGGGYASQHGVMVPYYAVVVLTGVLGGRRIWKATLRRRRTDGRRCGVCGYDLTGTRSSPRCPECGTERGAAATGGP